MRNVTVKQLRELVCDVATTAGFSQAVAQALSDSTVEAERHGKTAVGLDHVFTYLQAANTELINLNPEVTVQQITEAMVRCDADFGPMQYAYGAAEDALLDSARAQGIGLLMITNAFAGGELGYYNRRLAEHGMISIAWANSPAVMGVGGSSDRLLGTNPLSYGIPISDARAIVVDQASSSTASANIVQYAKRHEPIPEGWALDRHGQPTTDPSAALAGTLLPFGGYKGGNMGLFVEFMAILGGADTSLEAAPFMDGERRAGIGATILVVDPANLPDATGRIEALVERLTQQHGAKIRVTELDMPVRPIEVSDSVWHQLVTASRPPR